MAKGREGDIWPKRDSSGLVMARWLACGGAVDEASSGRGRRRGWTEDQSHLEQTTGTKKKTEKKKKREPGDSTE